MPILSKISTSKCRGALLSALAILGIAAGLNSCKPVEERDMAPSSPAPATPPAPAVEPAPVPATPPAPAIAEPVPAAASDAMTDGERIRPSTRRTASGLPDPLPGYLAWFRLGRADARPSGATPAPHSAAVQAYILLPNQYDFPPGRTLSAPLPTDTAILLEEKAAGKDFIDVVSVMMKSATGWTFSRHTRESPENPFSESGTETTACADCHSKPGTTDGVHSRLTLD